MDAATAPGSSPAAGLARPDARLRLLDLYVFDADAATALVMVLGAPLAERALLDPFHPAARYEFRIHLDDHEREDLTYRLAFLPTQYDQQPYSVERLSAADAGRDEATGAVIATGRTGEHVATQDGGRVWAGWAVQPLFLDLRQLRAVDGVVRRGEDADLTRWVRGVAQDSYTGTTVRSIVLTVPVGTDGLTTGRRIGTWATTRLTTGAGRWRQVGRTALPLVCTLFRPAGGDALGRRDETHPADDAALFGSAAADLVSSTVARLGTSDRPGAYADSVMERIVPDVLRYIVASPAVFGFARFNGRRLADNAPEVMFSLAMNSAVTTGLSAADVRRSQPEFPFVMPAEGG